MLDDREEEFESGYEEPVASKHLDSETLRAPLSLLAKHRPYTVPDTATIGTAIRILQEKHIGALLVVDSGNKLTGIFTERDVMRRVAGRRLDWDAVAVSSVMTLAPESLKMQDMVAYALNYMHLGGYRHVPVVNDQNEPVGIVSIKDVVAYLADYFPQEVCNLPPEPQRVGPDHRFGE